MSCTIVHFSCGAASAVAAKLVVSATPEAEVVNAYIEREDQDNRRFLADVEKWIGRTITVLRDTKYNADPDEVWKRKRFMVSQHGAPCSRELKRKLLDAYRNPEDTVAIGFTADEADRADNGFENANCIGCPKGGMGYWNKVRIVRPQRFAEVMAIQEDIGDGAYFFRDRKTGERFGLKDLPPTAGRHNEPAPSCGFFCEQAEKEIAA